MKYKLNKGVKKHQENIEVALLIVFLVTVAVNFNSLIMWAIRITG